MRIIHTADWHIGHSLNDWDRSDEHRAWMASLVELCDDLKPDVMLISGDIFDNLNPSGESYDILYACLKSLKLSCPKMKIVISSGNHDPVLRLEAPNSILDFIDIHAVASMKYLEDGTIDIARHLFSHSEGKETVHVLAIPYLRAIDLPGLSFSDRKGLSVSQAVESVISKMVSLTKEKTGGAGTLVAMAHLHCRGAIESQESERRIIIGGDHAVPADVFPSDISYVALGHIHRPQNIADRVRYSGSCFPLSATEIGYIHGVTLIEVDQGISSIRHIPIERPRRFIKVPQTGSILLKDLEDAITSEMIEGEASKPFLYVTLTSEGAPSILLNGAEKIISKFPVQLAGLNVLRANGGIVRTLQSSVNIKEMNPEDVFIAAFKAANDFDPNEQHIMVFRDVLGSV